MRSKVITVSLIWIVGLGVLRISSCGRGHFYTAFTGPGLAAQAERGPADIKGHLLFLR